jgi:DNA-binding transcriptional LysR family regulator
MPTHQPELSAFVAVARLGSFTRAAAELSLSQPALSRRIRMIEQSLQAELFDRLPGGARLTEAGKSFLPFAERALMNLRDGDEAVRGVGSGDRGRVGLAFVSTAGYRGITQAVERFHRQNAAVELSLHTGTSAEVSDLVLRGDADLGLRYRPDPDTALESRIIGQEDVQIICSPKHRLVGQKSVTPSALAEEVWIGYPYQRTSPDAGIKRMLLQYGLLGQRFMAVHSTELQIDLIAANFGIGLLTRSTVAKALRAGRLKTLRVPAVTNVVPIVLVRRKGTHESMAVRRLAALLAQAVSRTKVE